MRIWHRLLFTVALGSIGSAYGWALPPEAPNPVHGIAMHGEPKYGPDFPHLDYVNPDAPKGGELRMAAIGSFDSLNAFIVKGETAAGLGYLYDTLLTSTDDEAFTEYGLLAESLEVPEDRKWVIFNLRPQAKWHDGKPITAEDVVFTFETLKTKGHPFYRSYYADVATVEIVSERRVKFTFGGGDNRELPLILGQMPVLPKHYWEGRNFEETTLEPPLGSGSYRIESFEPGRHITYVRVADYWGKDLPIHRGRDNFDRIRYDYYRDSTVALEAFLGGQYDLRVESVAKNWATAYDVAPVHDGRIIKEEISHDLPQGMQAYVFNLRRAKFQHSQVRQAIGLMLDFEWANKNLFFNQYERTDSYFENSELASSGLPGPEEIAILEPLRGQIPEAVFTTPFQVPKTDGSGNIRPQIREALGLLKGAGWEVRNGVLTHTQSGEKMEFEILGDAPTDERIAQPFIQNLEKIGIKARVRIVDTAQYESRVENFDYDVIAVVLAQSLSPGNEQREYWSSQAAATPGSRNYIGIQNPAIDQLIDLIISAPDRESLVNRTRALDRVLLAHHYVIPQWHLSKYRLAYSAKLHRPEMSPPYGLPLDSWWMETGQPPAQ